MKKFFILTPKIILSDLLGLVVHINKLLAHPVQLFNLAILIF